MLKVDIEEKLKDILDKLVKEIGKNALTINCKKTKCIVVSNRKNPKCKLWIGDVNKYINLKIMEVFTKGWKM